MTVADHPFVEAAFAQARKCLRDARVAQENALIFALQVYEGGAVGRTARRLHPHWHRKRGLWLREALEARANAKEIRRRFRAALAKGSDVTPASVERSA